MRKTFALMLCCFGLLFSSMALAEVPDATWDTLVGQSVLLTNPQGKEIRGTLLDAQGETLRIERADGSVVTVGKSEVITAKNLAVYTSISGELKEPEPAPAEPTPPKATEVPSEATLGRDTSTEPEVETEVEPAPVKTDSAEPLPSEDQPFSIGVPVPNPELEMQDAVAGEVDGRAAAQMQSLTGPTAVSAGVGIAAGAITPLCCCAAPCAAAGPVFYGLQKVDLVDPGGTKTYNDAYNNAYSSELKKRRWIWTGVGAGAGLLVGIGVGYATMLTVDNTNLQPVF
ncbi:MAG: hypothetical protein ACI9VR_000056 [Cognaticolwellia sp.]